MDGPQTRKRPRPKCAIQSSATSDSIPGAKRIQTARNAAGQHSHQGKESLKVEGLGIIEDLQQRVVKLEELLSTGPQNANSGPIGDALVSEPSILQIDSNAAPLESPPSYLGTLVVKGSRSRYHGQNNRISLLNQFAEAKEFINQFTKDSTLIGLAKEVQFLQSKSQVPLNSPESVSDAQVSPEIWQLRAFLPPKGLCDKLLETYVKSFEKTLRVPHFPSFLRQYTQFWADPDNETPPSSNFLPQLTSVLSVALMLEDRRAQLDQSSCEYLNASAVKLVRDWLQKLGIKQQTELGALQVSVLILQARYLRHLSPDELWRATGALVRSAMVMGLHLNVSPSTLSVFQAEIRRRLWITIVEMDLQASIAFGMPVMAPQLDLGPLTPANLNDADFDESTTELPSSKPLHEWTDSLAQITLAASLAQRIRAMTLLNASQSDISQLVWHGRQLVEYLRQVPASLKPDHYSQSDNHPAILFNCVFIDVYIRRPLLCLYRPMMMMGSSLEDPAIQEIQRVCLESSLAILSHQDHFDPNVADLEIFNSNTYWDIFQTFCEDDILKAALNVCENIKLSTQQQSISQTLPDDQSSLSPAQRVSGHSKASLTRIVENTLDSLTRRIGEPGSNVKDVLLLAVVLQSVRARGSTQVDGWMRQGAKKALSACRQNLLASVEEKPTASDTTKLAQMPTFNLLTEAQFTSSPNFQLPDFLTNSSALATEFDKFQGDPFLFEEGSFGWSL